MGGHLAPLGRRANRQGFQMSASGRLPLQRSRRDGGKQEEEQRPPHTQFLCRTAASAKSLSAGPCHAGRSGTLHDFGLGDFHGNVTARRKAPRRIHGSSRRTGGRHGSEGPGNVTIWVGGRHPMSGGWTKGSFERKVKVRRRFIMRTRPRHLQEKKHYEVHWYL
jgi:hypothetical protein